MRQVPARILPLSAITEEDKHSFGPEVIELATLQHDGFPISNGFAVPVEYYHSFLNSDHVKKRVEHLVTTIHFDNPDSLMQVTNHIVHDLQRIPLPNQDELTRIFNDLSDESEVAIKITIHPITDTGQPLPIPFRPVHTITDDRSFLKEIQRAYTSLFHPLSVKYHNEHRLPLFASGLVILIQHVLPSEKSGIVHLTHPLLHQKDSILIKAVHGDIESLNEKHAIPEYIEIHKKTGEIKKHQQGLQKNTFIRKGPDLIMETLSQPNGFVLTEDEKDTLLQITQRLSRFLMVPRNIVFSFYQGSITLTDLKPSTTVHIPLHKEVTSSTFLTGTPYAPGICTGFPKIIHTSKDFSTVHTGDILVLKDIPQHIMPILHKVKGIIIEKPLLPGHTLALLRRIGIPIIGNVHHATEKISPTSVITVNGTKGTIQHGKKYKFSEIKSTHEQPKKMPTIPSYPVYTTLASENYFDLSNGIVIMMQEQSPEQLKRFITTLRTHTDIQTVLFDLTNNTGHAITTKLQAIRTFHTLFPSLLVGVILPSLDSLSELLEYKQYLAQYGLHRSSFFKVYITVATLLQSVVLNELFYAGIDGVILNTESLINDMRHANHIETPKKIIQSLIDEITNKHFTCFLAVHDDTLPINTSEISSVTALLIYTSLPKQKEYMIHTKYHMQ